ncbi:MAG: DUF2520 domain-containing protein [Lachnospiraceae bacterium]|nr:DUF2520 domain-containing protein [Lachnospiraceae bacterium]
MMELYESEIGFIGAGRVGVTLGRYLKENGLRLSGYYSRNPVHAKEAAAFTNSRYFEDLQHLIINSTVLFLTVNDGAIQRVVDDILALVSEGDSCNTICIKHKIFCHCSGALSSAVFKELEAAGGFGYSIHPMFAIHDRQTSYQKLSKTFFTIEGNPKHIADVAAMLERLGNPYQVIEARDKVLYHSGAVMASNLVISLYAMATDTLERCGFSEEGARQALMPLFFHNAENMEHSGLSEALTGPVDRGDIETIEKHMEVLTGREKTVYRLLSERLLELSRQKHADAIEQDFALFRRFASIEQLLTDKEDGMDHDRSED